MKLGLLSTFRLKREWRFLVGLARTLARVRSISAKSRTLICDDLEAAVDRWRGRPAIDFEGASATYGDLDAMANRHAHWAKAQSIAPGATVAIFLPNRLEYLTIWHGLAKVGVISALINNELTGEALVHCLDLSGARHCLVDGDTQGAFEAARSRLEQPMEGWSLAESPGALHDLTAATQGLSESRPDRSARAGITAKDIALLIFTSGTTGLPKAARITHMRAQLYMRGFAGATGARAGDRIYVTLPLYHATGGMCAMGAALLNGGSIILRRRFSAGHFWGDVVDGGATMFVYIGELCRYLANQPPQPLEKAHKLRLAFGNGLRPDIWGALESRFAVPRILEFYGSTEGNVSMFNFDGTLGAIGRAPRWLGGLLNVLLARFDVDKAAPVRGDDGFCIEARADEVGECLGRIAGGARTAYSGYADRSASEKKVLHDVRRRGDRWFRTGDLMRKDKDGYFYFVDRIGDTFRWKGQNVSTSEVSERLGGAPSVKEVNVYGVTVGNLEGRAGMAALVVDEGFDLAAFSRYVEGALPPYAQPVFLRLMPRIETTGTFKPRKTDLMADGFDPARVADALYVRDRGRGYLPVTPALYAGIVAGELRL